MVIYLHSPFDSFVSLFLMVIYVKSHLSRGQRSGLSFS